MKKWLLIIIGIILLIFILINLFISIYFYENSKNSYFRRINTVEFYGNGRFQIIESHDFEYYEQYGKNKDINVLYDFKTLKSIESKVYKYKEKNGKVYTIGENGYTILDYEIEEYIQTNSLDDLSESECINFKNIE